MTKKNANTDSIALAHHKDPCKNYKAKYGMAFFERKKIESYALWAVYLKEDGVNRYSRLPAGYGKTQTIEQAMLDLTAWCESNGISKDDIREDMVPWLLVKQLLSGKSGAEYFARQVRSRSSKKDILAITQEVRELVFQSPGKLVTTSLIVAEKFEKRHKNVLQAIENLPKNDFHRLNFQPVKYIDQKGKSRPMYEMTWKGFSMLAMGFTGAKAYVWKEKFLDAFEAMGNEIDRLKQQSQDPAWQLTRDETKVGFKWMNETLQERRAAIGKKTEPHHYSNEARLINAVLTNRFHGLDRNTLSASDLRLMADLQRYNAMLIAQDLPYHARKSVLMDRATQKLAGHATPLLKSGTANATLQ